MVLKTFLKARHVCHHESYYLLMEELETVVNLFRSCRPTKTPQSKVQCLIKEVNSNLPRFGSALMIPQ